MSSEDELKNQVREALRHQKVKLWEPPYVNDHSESVAAALEHLAAAWKTNGVIQKDGMSMVTDILQEWQSHALKKLAAKKQQLQSPTSVAARLHSSVRMEIKILGWKGDPLAAPSSAEATEFTENIHLDQSKIGIIVLTLKGVSTLQTDIELAAYLEKFFPANTNLRLIHRGKNLCSGENVTLGTLLQNTHSLEGNSIISLMCLVSTVEQERAANTQARIRAIRRAARQIRDTTQLEITDQRGKIVAMSGDDRLGFLTALALHRLGLNCDSQQEALVLLLEADVEWNNHPNLKAWKDRVDNYGLLQLDIAWMYLQLESLSNLPDSLKRLEEAERVLRKQVHANFVPLALTQADMGNAREVPPLAAVFAKLFLLQGIAYYHHNKTEKSQERLDQAHVLLQCLRSVAPEDSVRQLLEVIGSGAYEGRQYTDSDAIAALRKAQGDMDAAVVALTEEESKRRQIQRDREEQRQYGICQNETDPVNLAHLETLKPLLKGPSNQTNSWALDTANTDLAVGLLRLANNDLTRALEVYAEQGYDSHRVHALVDALDQKLVQHGLLGRGVLREKRKKRKLYENPPVDEIALASLVSMGVDHSKARAALKQSGNDIEKAMVWLSSADADGQEGVSGVSQDELGGDNSNGTPMLDESEGPAGEEDGANEVSERAEETGDAPTEGDHQAIAPRDILREMEWEAQELLHRELGDILEERDLEKEYLGKDLNEEWRLVQKYRRANP